MENLGVIWTTLVSYFGLCTMMINHANCELWFLWNCTTVTQIQFSKQSECIYNAKTDKKFKSLWKILESSGQQILKCSWYWYIIKKSILKIHFFHVINSCKAVGWPNPKLSCVQACISALNLCYMPIWFISIV